MDLLGWFSVLDFPMEDCKQEVKDGKAVLWLPRTPRRSCGCGYHPGEQGRSGKVVGAVRCPCKAGGCAVLGSEIMAARFHRQILHLCGFLFLLLCTIFFLLCILFLSLQRQSSALPTFGFQILHRNKTKHELPEGLRFNYL